MDNTTAPKPGPHLSAPQTPQPLSGIAKHGTFRDIAKRHANIADDLLNLCMDSTDDTELDYLAAIAHALTAIAYTELAPVRRGCEHHTPNTKPGARHE